VIAYLRNVERAGEVTTEKLRGREYSHVSFSPALDKIAAIDAGHAQALANVTSAQAEVWIDRDTKLPVMEKAVVKYKADGAGVEDSVEITLSFEKYNEAVEIRVP
jgi:hypothetical protein